MKLKNILVPTDFSECAEHALSYAIELAWKSRARLTLLHCYSIQVPAGEITIDIQPELIKQYQEDAQNGFTRLRENTPALKGLKHRELTRVGFIHSGILEVAEEIEADLIVMGTKGADNRLDAFFGSNTYHTIKKSGVPVLTVPEEAGFRPFRNILFAADFKHIEDINGLAMIKTLSKLFKAKIQVLHVGEGWAELSMNETREASAIVEYLGHTEDSYHFVKEEINVEAAIEDHLEEHKNELLVLIARKHQFPGSLFKKKLTRKTALHTKVPLLTLPDLR